MSQDDRQKRQIQSRNRSRTVYWVVTYVRVQVVVERIRKVTDLLVSRPHVVREMLVFPETKCQKHHEIVLSIDSTTLDLKPLRPTVKAV